MKCLHCPRKAAYGKRGLCMGCYMTPRVRALYPPRGKCAAAIRSRGETQGGTT